MKKLVNGFEVVTVSEIEDIAELAHAQAAVISTLFRSIARLTDDTEIKGLCSHGLLQSEMQANDIDVLRERVVEAGVETDEAPQTGSEK